MVKFFVIDNVSSKDGSTKQGYKSCQAETVYITNEGTRVISSDILWCGINQSSCMLAWKKPESLRNAL